MVKLTFDANSGQLSGRLDQWMKIPADLRVRRQWAVATLTVGSDGKPDKRPRRADGSEMQWRNPLAWLTFEEAVNAGQPAIGYILSDTDPFTIIDLDATDVQAERDRQAAIYQAFPSYAERSVSGKGLHIILIGRISGGVRRDNVEVYDQERFMLCTGDVVTDSPVQSHPELLERLVAEMGGVASTKEMPVSEAETLGDDEIIARIENSRQREKFVGLFRGPMAHSSENDMALLSILAFYTRNHDQILRIFARSVLYRPRGEADGKKGHTAETYHNKYLMDSLAGALTLRGVDTGADIEHGRKLVEQLMSKPAPDAPAHATDLDFPPGLVGEIAHYIYTTAARPIKEVAVAGALAFMAGVAGRQYNVSGDQGLNLYIILLGVTGMGKEGAKGGVDRLFEAMAQQAPGTKIFLGPRAVSGPALEKAPAEHNPCFVSFIGEVGVRLQQMLAKRNGDPLMKAAWLGLYTAARRGGRHQGAYHSKKEDRTNDVVFPCVSLFGESTQAEYYKAIGGGNFDSGFVPRFLTVAIHQTHVPPLGSQIALPPAPGLRDRLIQLGQYCVDLQVRDQYIEVRFGQGLSAVAVDDHYRVNFINATKEGPIRDAWTRSAMQVLKVAALLAIGENHLQPTIQAHHLEWAGRLVEGSVAELIHREATGDLAGDEAKRQPIIEELVKDAMALTPKGRENYKFPKGLLDKPHLIPYRFFHKRLSQRAAFQGPNMDQAIEKALSTAVGIGVLQRLSASQVVEACGRALEGAVYTIGDSFHADA